ncbi:hypothetical protein JDV02_000657 [Purpureocillium takamizusanense]|uniref:Flavin reductase like domain-containing protein n=1 Tax=Purpureocillium takamizusanense TaxID=2060973 RepID=A0A9Q8Q7S2_9HYPO|nr:uncharacterized protein JDV02_000657 [Purpureocillium takamizusanense]UNI13972.1 hypothetical protein JDV02_000657 [Purpureocillium takamizusanense]
MAAARVLLHDNNLASPGALLRVLLTTSSSPSSSSPAASSSSTASSYCWSTRRPLTTITPSSRHSPSSASTHNNHRFTPAAHHQQRSLTMSQPVSRNPHPDFKAVEAARPPWDDTERFHYTRTVAPEWRFGDGANRLRDNDDAAAAAAAATTTATSTTDKGRGNDDKTQPKQQKQHVAIDPYAPGRAPGNNYKLLISAITPRPIAFLSTVGADGHSGANLAPFSYFNMMSHDPPLFVVGFDRGGGGRPKDSLANVLATREAVINIIGEDFLEAANACSIDAPYGASEWDVSGLTPLRDCQTVRPARVAEAVFSVEVKVDHVRDYDRKGAAGEVPQKGCTLVVFEGTRIWVREDALDEQQNLVDPAVLRPVSRLGGISYGRLTQAVEIPRPSFEKDLGGREGLAKLQGPKN